MLKYWRRCGIRVVGYIDDLIFFAGFYEEAVKLWKRVVGEVKALGWQIAWDKSMKEPKQAVVTLELVLNSVAGKFFVPEEKISKLIANIDYVLQKNDNGRLVVREVARVVGLIIAMRRAIFQVRWRTIALHRSINEVIFQGLEPWEYSYSETGDRWDWKMQLSEKAVQELWWWKENVHRVNGSDIWVHTSTITITTDAAETGWAAWTEGMVARGGMIEQKRYQHSNWRELVAVERGLVALLGDRQIEGKLL
jgi:hypothetical protein